MKRGPVAKPAVPALRIEMSGEVQRRVRQHARSSMSAEICGVLIGSIQPGVTVIGASIEGEAAREGGSHVTFTQDTWTHIYQVKDSKYPDERIVGWYHSHPGFGVFLSEHDVFIHRNFFSDPNQVAWVFDPHNDEEGCFAWERGEIVRVREIAVQGGSDGPVLGVEPESAPGIPADEDSHPPSGRRAGAARMARWAALIITHLCVLILGIAIGAIFLAPVIVLPEHLSERPRSTQPHLPEAPPK